MVKLRRYDWEVQEKLREIRERRERERAERERAERAERERSEAAHRLWQAKEAQARAAQRERLQDWGRRLKEAEVAHQAEAARLAALPRLELEGTPGDTPEPAVQPEPAPQKTGPGPGAPTRLNWKELDPLIDFLLAIAKMAGAPGQARIKAWLREYCRLKGWAIPSEDSVEKRIQLRKKRNSSSG
jgi:hypothetical protein